MKQISVLIILVFITVAVRAQLKVGDNTTTINPSSVLQADAMPGTTRQGLLVPRVSLTNTTSFTPLASHVAGMVVYNNATAGDVTPGFYINNGTQWQRIAISAASNSATSNTIYSGDGALTGNRIVTTGTYNLAFAGTGQVFIGGSTSKGGGAAALEVSKNAGIFTADFFGAANGSIIRTFGSRGTVASPTATQSGDYFGGIRFAGHDGTAYSLGQASVEAQASQNWTSAARGTSIVFSTTDNNSVTRTERMRILQNGFVGIGTSSPSAKLHVAGDVGIGVGAGSSYNALWLANDNGQANNTFRVDGWANFLQIVAQSNTGSTSGAGISFSTGEAAAGTTERMRILDNGNVGIGTTNPVSKLQVDGNVGIGTGTSDGVVNALLIANDGGDSKNYLNVNGINNMLALRAVSGPGATAGTTIILATGTAGGGTATRMVIASDGKVGIDDLAPANLLSLGKSFGANPGDLAAKKLAVYQNEAGQDFYGLGVSNSTLEIHAGSTQTEAPGMVLLASGNVGINTTTPAAKLQVNGDIGIGTGGVGTHVNINALWLKNDDGDSKNGLYVNGYQNTLQLIAESSPGSLAGTKISFMTSDAGGGINERVTISSNGNVGIGTSSPSDKLAIMGGNAVVTGGCFVVGSDERIKKDITPYAKGLETLLQLNPVSYYFKPGFGPAKEQLQAGLIAQQVQAVDPDMVILPESENGYLALRYQDISIMSINAFKTIHAEMEQLKAENSELRKMLNELLANMKKTNSK